MEARQIAGLFTRSRAAASYGTLALIMDDSKIQVPPEAEHQSPERCFASENCSGAHLSQLTASRIYWGIIFVQLVVLLMTVGVFFFTATLGIFQIGLITTFAFPYPADQIVANTLEIAFYLGWFVMLAPITGSDLPAGCRATQISIRICLVILTAAAVFGYLPIFGQLRPAFDTIDGVLQLLTIIPTIAIIPLQYLYVGHLAQLVSNTKLKRTARIWTWLAPVILLVPVIFMYAVHEIFFWFAIFAILISVIQYWNILNRLRVTFKRNLVSRAQIDR